MKKPNVVSLFSGCGGLDYGFNLSGYNIIWANDILKDACETYKLNIGDHIKNIDITKLDLATIPKANVIIGGPPCQGFSGIGKRDPNDKRSDLIYSYIDVVERVQPAIFLFENVTGIKSSKSKKNDNNNLDQPSLFTNGDMEVVNENNKAEIRLTNGVLENIKRGFNQIGYHINIYTLNAADYGVPQRRKRVFIVGNKLNKDILPPNPTHFENPQMGPKWVTSFEAISDLGIPTDDGIVTYFHEPVGSFQKLMRRKHLN